MRYVLHKDAAYEFEVEIVKLIGEPKSIRSIDFRSLIANFCR